MPSRLLIAILSLTSLAASAEVIVKMSPAGPIRSLAAARDEVRRIKKADSSSAIRVVIENGAYQMDAPVHFTDEDSGTAQAPITYEAAANARPVISGGKRITGWQPAAGGLWKAQIDEVHQGRWCFEQLWVDGRRAVRARSPNTGYFSMYSQAGADAFPGMKEPVFQSFIVRPAEMALLKSIPAAELPDVLLIAMHTWTVGHCRIEALNEQARAVKIKGRSRYPFVEFEPDQRFTVENFRSALDAAGEWFLSRDGELLYHPLPGDDMTKAEVVAPFAERLIVFEGDWQKGGAVSHVAFRGLSFQHTQSLYGPDGHHDGQAASAVGAAIELDGSRHIAFEDCEIARTGGYGIWFRRGCSECSVTRSHLHDLGGGGVRIGDTSMPKSDGELVRRIAIDDCIIHSGGRRYPSACGVFLAHAADCSVTHCDIADLFYTGISAGWVWGYSHSPSKRNRFDHNHIHHLGHGVLSDMGGFYGLGKAEGTTVSGNHAHHIASYRYGGWGLYTDEGSTGVTMENNLVHDTSESTFHQHYGKWNQISNNIFAFGEKAQIQRSRPEKHCSFAYERNIVVHDRGELLHGSWYNWEPGTLEMRQNLYWRLDGKPPQFLDTDLAGWQKRSGRDEGSIVADPLFIDAAKRDFRLKPESPALKLGFKPFDFTQAGVRGGADSGWRKLAASLSFPQWAETTQPWPMPEFSLHEGFEHMGLSFPTVPRQEIHWKNKGDSIFVSDEQAATGSRSLKITDAPGLDPVWEPHYILKPKYQDGIVTVSCSLRLEEKAKLFIEWRNEGHPYLTGPSLWFERGEIVERTSKTRIAVPVNEWFRIEAVAGAGTKANGKWLLRVTLPGQPAKEYPGLPCQAGWDELGWLGFVSTAEVKTAFFVDDLKIQRSN